MQIPRRTQAGDEKRFILTRVFPGAYTMENIIVKPMREKSSLDAVLHREPRMVGSRWKT